MCMHSYVYACVCACVCVFSYEKFIEDKGVPICMHIELRPSMHSHEPNYIAQVTKGKKKGRLQIKLSDS